jgi:hypothetical protein
VDLPDDPSELRQWLERLGLTDAALLAVLTNQDLAELDHEQLRLLHGLLEARWRIDHPEDGASERGGR